MESPKIPAADGPQVFDEFLLKVMREQDEMLKRNTPHAIPLAVGNAIGLGCTPEEAIEFEKLLNAGSNFTEAIKTLAESRWKNQPAR